MAAMPNQNLLSSFAPQGFQQAGQFIPNQLFTSSATGLPALTTGAGDRFNQQFNYKTHFDPRQAFQFSDVPTLNVGDIYSPQMDMARRDITRQADLTREQMLSDLNSRGMLTTGATSQGMYRLGQDTSNQLADLSSQYSLQQAQQQLQEDQMRRQMDYQRQVDQAAELFRQQGAPDDQAKFWPSKPCRDTTRISQGSREPWRSATAIPATGRERCTSTQGRQQATAEEQLANLMRRQPLEDLMAMWKQQAGQTGATEGSPGWLGC
jgi:hypothetical protein